MKKLHRFTLLRMLTPLLAEIPPSQRLRMYTVLAHERPHRFDHQIRINTFFPPIPSQSFDRFFRIVLNRNRALYQVYLAVTSACPYHCQHCSYGGRTQSQLSTQQLLDLINDIKTLGAAIIGFTGGEPLLRNDLETLITAAGPEMTTVFFTTGYHLTPTRAQQLKEAGLGSIVIGLESAHPHTHDTIRGTPGSYEGGLRAIQTCVDGGLYTAIETMGTREKIRTNDLERIYDIACQYNVGELRILSPVATGSWSGHPENMLTTEEISYLQQFHRNHNRQKNGPCVATSAFIESADMFGCNAGYHHLFIDAAGEVCPCDLTPISFGNITTQSLKEIWENMKRYFPQPRNSCLMSEISKKITASSLPLSPSQSRRLIPKIEPHTPLPGIYQRIFK